MVPTLTAVTFDARDPERLARFWAGLLGRDVVADGRGPLLPGRDAQVGLRFAASEAPATRPNRAHLHVTSETDAAQQEHVARALDLGASHLDVGQLPEEGHIVLADPEGNELCVIEAGNAYLAGTGLLGEVACDGTREVGLFWSEALAWPLVWDRDEETAIQSPSGGTKVAWGGPPLHPRHGRAAQRLELAAGADLAGEIERLVGLGATRRGEVDGGVELADPDGTEFLVTG